MSGGGECGQPWHRLDSLQRPAEMELGAEGDSVVSFEKTWGFKPGRYQSKSERFDR
jgi:hypothetical protein